MFLKNSLAIQILHCIVTVYPKPNRDASSSSQKTIHHLSLGAIRPTIKVMVKTILVNPAFSEYVIPFFIGLTPLLYILTNGK